MTTNYVSFDVQKCEKSMFIITSKIKQVLSVKVCSINLVIFPLIRLWNNVVWRV